MNKPPVPDSATLPRLDALFSQARRYFLGQGAGVGLGALALGQLQQAARATEAASTRGLPGLPHHAPRARNVIYLTQSGGPSQLELFDDKPGLREWAGKELPESVRQGQRLTTMTANQQQLIMPARTRFTRHGQSGATIGEWLPYHGRVADDLCFVKSMVTDQINHAPAMTKMLTGHQLPGRPSLGAWTSYGLGSENRNLPDYLVLISRMKRPSDQPLYDHYWGSGFLASRYQGVKLRNARDPVLYLQDPAGLPRELRRSMLDGLGELNQLRFDQTGDPEIETRIRQYEMAWRMQTSIPELADRNRPLNFTGPIPVVPEVMPPTVSWHAGLLNEACGSYNSFIQIGTIIAASVPGAWRGVAIPIRPARRWLRISSNGGCSTRPLCYGGVNSGGAWLARGNGTVPREAAIIIPAASRCGWRAEEFGPVSLTARPTSSATMSRKTRCMSAICTPRCCTCWKLNTMAFPTAFKGWTSN